jgi:hypothetical protein
MGTSEYGLGARRNSPRAVPVPLSAEALEALEDTVSVPAYDCRRVTSGIVHLRDAFPQWLLPVIRARLESDGEIRRSAAVVASWARYSEGVDEHGKRIAVGDSLRDRLMERAGRQRRDPDAFIQDEIFGDLGALTTRGHNTEGSHD